MNLPKNAWKQEKGRVGQYVANFEVKNKFLLIFILFDQKNCLNK